MQICLDPQWLCSGRSSTQFLLCDSSSCNVFFFLSTCEVNERVSKRASQNLAFFLNPPQKKTALAALLSSSSKPSSPAVQVDESAWVLFVPFCLWFPVPSFLLLWFLLLSHLLRLWFQRLLLMIWLTPHFQLLFPLCLLNNSFHSVDQARQSLNCLPYQNLFRCDASPEALLSIIILFLLFVCCFGSWHIDELSARCLHCFSFAQGLCDELIVRSTANLDQIGSVAAGQHTWQNTLQLLADDEVVCISSFL